MRCDASAVRAARSRAGALLRRGRLPRHRGCVGPGASGRRSDGAYGRRRARRRRAIRRRSVRSPGRTPRSRSGPATRRSAERFVTTTPTRGDPRASIQRRMSGVTESSISISDAAPRDRCLPHECRPFAVVRRRRSAQESSPPTPTPRRRDVAASDRVRSPRRGRCRRALRRVVEVELDDADRELGVG